MCSFIKTLSKTEHRDYSASSRYVLYNKKFPNRAPPGTEANPPKKLDSWWCTCRRRGRAVSSLGAAAGADGRFGIVAGFDLGSEDGFPDPYKGTKLSSLTGALQTGQCFDWEWKWIHLYRQGQQNKWPHNVTIGSLAISRHMLHPKLFDTSSSLLKDILVPITHVISESRLTQLKPSNGLVSNMQNWSKFQWKWFKVSILFFT